MFCFCFFRAFWPSLHTCSTKRFRGKGHTHRRVVVCLWTHHLLAGRRGPTPCREGARWTAAPNRPRQTRPCSGPSTRRSAPQTPDPGPGTVPPATRMWRGPAVVQILPFSENDYNNRSVRPEYNQIKAGITKNRPQEHRRQPQTPQSPPCINRMLLIYQKFAYKVTLYLTMFQF